MNQATFDRLLEVCAQFPTDWSTFLVAGDAAEELAEPLLAYALRWMGHRQRKPVLRVGGFQRPWLWLTARRRTGSPFICSLKQSAPCAVLPFRLFDLTHSQGRSPNGSRAFVDLFHAVDALSVALESLRQDVAY
jgi:hypothetical protein